MQTEILAAPFIILFIGSAIVCNQLAKARKLKASFWTAMGLLFGPLAIVFVLLSRGDSK